MSNVLIEGELSFDFTSAVFAEKFDQEGVPNPVGMKRVDFIVEESKQVLLIEVKDPSQQGGHPKGKESFQERIRGNTLIAEELVPKARDSYCFQHLMGKDTRPFLYIVVLGLESFPNEAALLMGFKDRLLARIRKETNEEWKRQYVQDCIVTTVNHWGDVFAEYPLSRRKSPTGD